MESLLEEKQILPTEAWHVEIKKTSLYLPAITSVTEKEKGLRGRSGVRGLRAFANRSSVESELAERVKGPMNPISLLLPCTC